MCLLFGHLCQLLVFSVCKLAHLHILHTLAIHCEKLCGEKPCYVIITEAECAKEVYCILRIWNSCPESNPSYYAYIIIC